MSEESSPASSSGVGRSRSGTLPEISLRRDHSPALQPQLTVIAHPDVDRIGHVARLGLPWPDEVLVDRYRPLFGPPRTRGEQALADRALSRRPLVLRWLDDERFVIDARKTSRSVFVDGESLEGSRTYPVEALRTRGLVLLLSRRVVLFLHAVPPVSMATDADLGLIGESPALIQIRNEIVTAAQTRSPVLIQGETGTGKELVAQALHTCSARRGPMVAVNMASLQAETATAELFGSMSGAFTGVGSKRGLMRRADGGTLFLDEIGDAPQAVQAALLRVLEDGVVKPVGGDREERVDLRLVTATDADLEEAADRGTFRPQLLFRLRSHSLRLPPLRERREDLGRLLVALTRASLASAPRASSLRPRGDWFPAEMVDGLMRCSWPGNVRQLRAVAEQIVALAAEAKGRPDPRRILERFEADLNEFEPSARDAGSSNPPLVSAADPENRQAADLSADEIREAISAAPSVVAAARSLGVSRAALYAQMKRLGMPTTEDVDDEAVLRAHEAAGGDVGTMARILGVGKQGLFKRLRRMKLR